MQSIKRSLKTILKQPDYPTPYGEFTSSLKLCNSRAIPYRRPTPYGEITKAIYVSFSYCHYKKWQSSDRPLTGKLLAVGTIALVMTAMGGNRPTPYGEITRRRLLWIRIRHRWKSSDPLRGIYPLHFQCLPLRALQTLLRRGEFNIVTHNPSLD